MSKEMPEWLKDKSYELMLELSQIQNQTGSWKIVQRLEEQVDDLEEKQKLRPIAECKFIPLKDYLLFDGNTSSFEVGYWTDKHNNPGEWHTIINPTHWTQLPKVAE